MATTIQVYPTTTVSNAKADSFAKLFHGSKICTTPTIHSSTAENTKPGTRKSTSQAIR
jgi:hypothetical protein